MGIGNYQKAVEIIMQNEHECYFAGSRSESDIFLAEKALGITFSGSYKEFLKQFGAGSIGSEEIYGISSLNFEKSTVPNAIWYTLSERKESNLPSNLLVIYSTGSDEIFCLDFNKLNLHSEPTVVVFVPGIDLIHQTYEVISEDFGDFLLERVTEAIKNI